MDQPVGGSERYINRELSWLAFNARVLEEAQDKTTPLLERVKFLSICSSNLDEFFMVRVAGLRAQAFRSGIAQDINPDQLPAFEQLQAIREQTESFFSQQYECLNQEIIPALRSHGLAIVSHDEVQDDGPLDTYFRETVFPIITPMAIDPSHPRPRYHNRSIYIVARLRRRKGLGPRRLYAVVQLPQVLPRLVNVASDGKVQRFILMEDLIRARLPMLFGGFEVESSTTFRLTRDGDLDLIEQESDDMLRLIEDRLKARRRADAVRLEVSADADEDLIDMIVQQEQLSAGQASKGGYSEVYRIDGPVDLTGLTSLARQSGFDSLRDPEFVAETPRGLRRSGETLWHAIERHDILLHHPYDSFGPVEDFIALAAEDPQVLAIKQTLYRTSGDSRIIRSLVIAAENGKHVTALVELKARFDEAANVEWARQLERSGVHVVYGFMDHKTHCKVSMVIRQEDQGVRRYAHLGTGNYNKTTARIYTDLGLFTADPEVTSDVSALFNLLTGYSQGHNWRKLVVAPEWLQKRTLELIREQTDRAKEGKSSRIFAKLNSLVDPEVIEALFEASQAGVPIDLIVRGICCLRPAIPGVSDNIRVRSIVDRFLEHSRIMVFGVEDEAQVYLSSADWMPRNFHRRVEVMFPVESPALRKRILTEIIPTYQKDNVKSRELCADGTYKRVQQNEGETPYRSQHEILEIHRKNALRRQAARLGRHRTSESGSN